MSVDVGEILRRSCASRVSLGIGYSETVAMTLVLGRLTGCLTKSIE